MTRTESDLRRLTRLLRESALLLEASRGSADGEFRAGSIDLAIRTMRAAGVAIDRVAEPQVNTRPRPASVLQGPWAATVALPAETL